MWVDVLKTQSTCCLICMRIPSGRKDCLMPVLSPQCNSNFEHYIGPGIIYDKNHIREDELTYSSSDASFEKIIGKPWWKMVTIFFYIMMTSSGIILCMCPANRKRRYIVTSSPIGSRHTQIYPCILYFVIPFPIDAILSLFKLNFSC